MSTRPFRIWNAKEKKHLVGRNYAIQRNAHDGALQLVRWGAVGTSLEVLDVDHGNKLLGQYVRKPTHIWFQGPEKINESR